MVMLLGSLRLNGPESKQPNVLGDTCHAIELSSGSVPLDPNDGDILSHPLSDVFDEWALPPGLGGWGCMSFTTSCTWNGKSGIAYRLAVGRVEKEAWGEYKGRY